tara:strand:- start:333 stop:785 length:453 start_codon:yes stop_codon:yes gene_type:complete
MDDFPFYEKMKLPQIQLVFAILITTICIYDYISGFIFAMVIMLIYYEIYNKKKTKEYNNKVGDRYNINIKDKLFENFVQKYETNKINDNKILLDFISEKHLDDAQNGYIFHEDNYANNNLNKFDYDIQGIANTENNIVGIDLNYVKNNIK